MTPKSSKTVPVSGVTKHRACDECRSRKLACSKEPDGCTRCRRERIACHYSPQKPMGRPRKRRQPDGSPQSSPQQRQSPEHGDTTYLPGYESMSMFSMNPMSFDAAGQMVAQHPDQGLGYLNMLPDTNTSSLTAPSDTHDFMAQGAFDIQPYSLGLDTGTGLVPDLGFPDRDESSKQIPKHMSHTLGRYLASQHQAVPVEPAESINSDASNPAESPGSSQPHSFKPAPTVACSCLSSLYLAMDSLSRLPTDLFAAMRVARNASKVAYEVINCPFCSNHIAFEDLTTSPPVQCFQNFMCLGALIPTACNAYMGILDMIDAQTAKAKEDGRNIWFSLRDVGGLWGSIAEQPDRCPRLYDFEHRAVDPDSWRRTMRAILRLDIHGVSDISDEGLTTPVHQGLRDIVRLLEERSNKRHEILDNLIASGQAPVNHQPLFGIRQMQSLPQEQRVCWRMLDAARAALDNLVIS